MSATQSHHFNVHIWGELLYKSEKLKNPEITALHALWQNGMKGNFLLLTSLFVHLSCCILVVENVVD